MKIIWVGKWEYERYNMPNSGKFTIEFKVGVVDLSIKFDGPNTKMYEVDIKC